MKRAGAFKQLWSLPSGRVCVVVLGLILLMGLSAPLLPIANPAAIDLANKLSGPTWQHWLGTDSLGRDLLSRLIWGTNTSVLTALAATALTASFGAFYGALSAATTPRIDNAMMRFCDLWMSFPSEVMILTVVGLLGPGVQNIVFGCFIAKWPWYARMIRSIARRIRDAGYVRFAMVSGASRARVMREHLLPNISADILVLATLDVGSVLLMISSLSFLGLGVSAPSSEWGMMLAEAKNVLTLYPWQMVPPGVMILLTVSMLHLLGDALARVLDPNQRFENQ